MNTKEKWLLLLNKKTVNKNISDFNNPNWVVQIFEFNNKEAHRCDVARYDKCKSTWVIVNAVTGSKIGNKSTNTENILKYYRTLFETIKVYDSKEEFIKDNFDIAIQLW